MTVSDSRAIDGFKYDQVSRHIVALVDKGLLKPGDRLPSLRGLSRQLKVSITTVSQAYAALERRGLVKTRPQSGFYLRSAVSQAPGPPGKTSTSGRPRKVRFGELFEEIFMMANDPHVAPLGAAKPAVELMPVKGLVRATSRAAARAPQAALDYCFPPGDLELRRLIAQRYVEVGLDVAPEKVVVTTGATEALALSLQTVARRGDIIAVESPTYFSVLRLIERMGMLAVEIDTDPATGLCLEALENAIDTMDVQAVLTVPNFSNPIGSLMPEDKKRDLVALLERHGIPLIEDDIYGELYFHGPRPGVAHTHSRKGQVLTCSSFSKTLAPGYRIGWVIADRYRDDVLEWKQATSSAVASLPQFAVAEFLRTGEYERHLVRLRAAYHEQVQKMRFVLGRHFPAGTRVTNPQGGFVLWVELPPGVDCLEVFSRALAANIGITPGVLFSATRRYRNAIRINCGYPWSAAIEQAVIRLGGIVAALQP